jgi:ABC-type nitrate/sulfonate/bicarbonate transport system substrate-binding protein
MGDMKRIRLGLYAPGCLPGYHLPYYAAATTGNEFPRYGLEVEPTDSEPGIDNVLAVAAGRNDACLTSTAYYLRAKAADSSLDAAFVFMVARRPHAAAYVVAGRAGPAGRPITGFRDLEGARFVGEAGSSFHLEYEALLRRFDVTPGPTIEVLEGREIRALLDGQGDVMVEFIEVAPRLRGHARRAGRDLLALPFYKAGLRAYGSGLVAGPRLMRDQPDLLARLIAALRDALVETRRDPAPRVAALRQRLRGVTPERAIDGWRASETLIFHGDLGAMDIDGWGETLRHFVEVYGAGEGLEPRSLFDSSFLATARV